MSKRAKILDAAIPYHADACTSWKVGEWGSRMTGLGAGCTLACYPKMTQTEIRQRAFYTRVCAALEAGWNAPPRPITQDTAWAHRIGRHNQ